MAIAAAPQQTVSVNISTAVTSATVTIADAPAGSVLIFHWGSLGNTQTVTPSCPNTTWTKIAGASTNSTNTEELWMGVVAGGSTGTTVTFTGTQTFNITNIRGQIAEWRGVYPAVYATSTSSGTSNVMTTPSATPVAGKNALIIGTMRAHASVSLSSGPTNSFTDPNVSGSALSRMAWRVVASATGSYSTAWTMSGSAAYYSAIAVLYDTAPAAGGADHLTISTQPNGGTSTVQFSTQPVVQIRDSSDATVSGSTASVTAALNVISGSGTLGGTTTINAVSGVASFTNLKVTGTGTYTLTFTSAGLSQVTSSQFTVTGITPSPYINQATDGTDPGVNFGLFTPQVTVAKTGDRRSATRNMPTGTYEGATLPDFYNDLTVPSKKAGGTTWNVTNASTLNTAITNSVAGDEIVIPAGVANRISGNFLLPVKAGTDSTPGTDNVVTIRTSAIASLPSGVRVLGPDAAADLGLSATDTELLAHVRGTDPTKPVFYTTNGTQGWRLMGLNIDVDPTIIGISGSIAYNAPGWGGPYARIVYLGNGDGTIQNTVAKTPKNMVVDRCLIRGHTNLHCRIGLAMQCDNSYCIDSTVEEIHAVNEGDCQAILSYNCSGNLAVINTSLAASSECIVYGGGDNAIAGATMQNIELKWLHLFKPLRWKANDPSYINFQWEIKNLLEIKKAYKLYAEGCFSNKSWDQAQVGYAWLIKNQYNNTTNVYTSDIVIRYCDFTKAAIGISVAGGTQSDNLDDKTVRRVILAHCLFDEIGTSQWDSGQQFGQCYRFSATADCRVIHNTTHQQRMIAYILTAGVSDGGDGKNDNLQFRDNIHGPANTNSFKAAGATQGGVSMTQDAPGGTIHGCVLVAQPSGEYTGANFTGNFFPGTDSAVGYANAATRDYSLLGTTQGGNPPAVATRLDVALPPGNGTSGTPLPQQPSIRMLDQFDAPISSTATVTATVTAGGATITAGSTAVMSAGVANFSGLTLTDTVTEPITITFSSPGVTSVTATFTLTVPSTAAKLGIKTAPAGIVSGVVFSTQPQINVLDASNALVGSATNTVSVAVTSGTATLSGTTSKAAVAGVATFTDLKLTGTGTVILTFTASGLTGVSTSTLAIQVTTSSNTLPDALPSKYSAKVGKSLLSLFIIS